MSAKKQLTTVHQLEDIPRFTSETEEHAFWETHELSDALWDQAEPLTEDELPAARSSTSRVVVPLVGQTLRRVKALARRRHKAYQTLLQEFITERLDEEEQHPHRRKPRVPPTG